jgi:hypothetical protein
MGRTRTDMGTAFSTHEEKRNAYRILVGKPEGKRPLGRSRHRWEDNIVSIWGCDYRRDMDW